MIRWIGIFAIAIVALGAPGCDGSDDDDDRGNRFGNQPGGPPPALEVVVTDAPFPAQCFLETTLIFDRLELIPATAAAGSGPIEPITVTAIPQSIDVLALSGGRVESLAVAQTFTPGRYATARVHLAGGVVTFTDGFQKTFPPPAAPLEIPIEPPLVVSDPAGGTGSPAALTSRLTLDVDLPQTFSRASSGTGSCDDLKDQNGMVFAPTVRAIGNERALLRIEGVVTDGSSSDDGLPDVTVTASSRTRQDQVYSTRTGDGTGGTPPGFYMILVEPDSYNLTFEHPERGAAPPVIVEVEDSNVQRDASIP